MSNPPRPTPVIAGGVTQLFVDDIEREYGKGSGVFQSRVLGQFADDGDETLCRRSWLLASSERWRSGELEHMTAEEPFVVAVDPARYGPDSTVLAIRQGPVLRELVTWQRADTMATTGRVITELRKRGIGPRQRVAVPAEDRGWLNATEVTVGGERIVIDEVGVGGPDAGATQGRAGLVGSVKFLGRFWADSPAHWGRSDVSV